MFLHTRSFSPLPSHQLIRTLHFFKNECIYHLKLSIFPPQPWNHPLPLLDFAGLCLEFYVTPSKTRMVYETQVCEHLKKNKGSTSHWKSASRSEGELYQHHLIAFCDKVIRRKTQGTSRGIPNWARHAAKSYSMNPVSKNELLLTPDMQMPASGALLLLRVGPLIPR